MTVTPAAGPTTTAPAPDIDELRRVAADALVAIARHRSDDRQWRVLGPLVSAAANHLRAAIGTPVVATSAPAPAIVSQRDLATAAHALLARDVRIVDERAGSDFATLALEITLASS